ncbi:hypothetical protein J685_3150 [Acinetobacter baumannii 541915]|uniref:hypothetical protein n=1 Tax=Acinetobacter baumannii TaxID=470 RepID=UPI000446C3F0|nr:hypothetical protein [Acinetobacter baumannii]EXR79062.1 hypothetical protein J685_3151 [Acinetobacter baumannii 541915]EXR79078.1 hypothetical protein J685_3150 [Acinetobacter baumannii 541915]
MDHLLVAQTQIPDFQQYKLSAVESALSKVKTNKKSRMTVASLLLNLIHRW